MDRIKVKNVFAAVFEKRALDPLLEVLNKKEVKFWGTAGTTKYLKSKGFDAQSVVTDFGFDGRVKSLERSLFVRILADRSKKQHMDELKRLKLEPIDLVIVDLYRPDQNNFPESMDIGGQTLIRAAIKNYQNVALAFNNQSINDLVAELNKNQGSTLLAFRKAQAKEALEFIMKRAKLEKEMLRS